MRRVGRFVAVVCVLCISAGGIAWALEIQFPAKAKVRATVVVDEAGQILFGAVPAPVTVTNFPPSSNEPAYQEWSTYIEGSVPSGTVVYTVPAGQQLVLTDVVAFAESCALKVDRDAATVLLTNQPISLTTGIVFAPGESIVIGQGYCSSFTMSGRLRAVS